VALKIIAISFYDGSCEVFFSFCVWPFYDLFFFYHKAFFSPFNVILIILLLFRRFRHWDWHQLISANIFLLHPFFRLKNLLSPSWKVRFDVSD